MNMITVPFTKNANFDPRNFHMLERWQNLAQIGLAEAHGGNPDSWIPVEVDLGDNNTPGSGTTKFIYDEQTALLGKRQKLTFKANELSSASAIAAWAHKVAQMKAPYVLTSIEPTKGEAIISVLSPITIHVRNVVARILGCAPYDVEVRTGLDDEGLLSEVNITRLPPTTGIDKLKDQLTYAAKKAIGHIGWKMSYSAEFHTARLFAGLTPDFSFSPFVWEEFGTIQADDSKPLFNEKLWNRLPFASDPFGDTLALDLALNPHCAISGGTGSGKSATLRALIVAALKNDFQLAVIDPTKKAGDFAMFLPWVIEGGFGAANVIDARNTILTIYKEMERRLGVITAKYGKSNWFELPSEVRESENIRPLLVVVDEASSAVISDKVPKSLDKKSQEYKFAVEDAEARDLILLYIKRLAREARSSGIHLIISTQRWDSSDFGGGQLKANCGNRILLGNSDATAINMAFQTPSKMTEQYELAQGAEAEEGDGDAMDIPARVPGRGVAEFTGRSPQAGVAFQGWFSSETEILKSLEDVPKRPAELSAIPVDPRATEEDESDLDALASML